MSDRAFQNVVRPVVVSYHDQQIGKGTSVETSRAIEIKGIYDIPPTIAEVGFSFAVQLVDDRTCTVEVSWPDLLNPNPLALEGTYLWVLVLARPSLLINADRYQISFTYTGPMGQPTITGFQINVSGPDNAATLGFLYE
jgi:hypothetical protein